jgi:hypothetical protein
VATFGAAFKACPLRAVADGVSGEKKWKFDIDELEGRMSECSCDVHRRAGG